MTRRLPTYHEPDDADLRAVGQLLFVLALVAALTLFVAWKVLV